MNKKIYVGNGNKKSDKWIKASLCIDEILANEEYITISKNNKRYISLDINLYDEANQYGKDVSITVDTWKPERMKADIALEDEINLEELPF